VPARILLITGSTRGGSTNSAALRTIQHVAPPEATAVLYEGLAGLPAFNPDDDGPGAETPTPVTELRRQIVEAGAVVFCTPEYAGTLPGSFKNLLDWTVGDGGLYGKPVAWVNVANEGRGGGAQATLDTVLSYVGAAVIEAACRRLPVSRDWVGADGVITDAGFRAAMAEVAATLAAVIASDGDGASTPGAL
jgi:chromate reductase, NAD(P)H dehydrogenase (quinone)